MNILINPEYLESWFENSSEVCHPKPLRPAGAQRRPDSIFENLIDAEKSEDTCLEI